MRSPFHPINSIASILLIVSILFAFSFSARAANRMTATELEWFFLTLPQKERDILAQLLDAQSSEVPVLMDQLNWYYRHAASYPVAGWADYHDIVKWVAENLKVPTHGDEGTYQLERKIVAQLFVERWDEFSQLQQEKFKQLVIIDLKDKGWTHRGEVERAWTAVAGRVLVGSLMALMDAGIYGQLVSSAGAILYEMGPNYNKLVPAVVYIHLLKQMRINERLAAEKFAEEEKPTLLENSLGTLVLVLLAGMGVLLVSVSRRIPTREHSTLAVRLWVRAPFAATVMFVLFIASLWFFPPADLSTRLSRVEHTPVETDFFGPGTFLRLQKVSLRFNQSPADSPPEYYLRIFRNDLLFFDADKMPTFWNGAEFESVLGGLPLRWLSGDVYEVRVYEPKRFAFDKATLTFRLEAALGENPFHKSWRAQGPPAATLAFQTSPFELKLD
ncbi:MAG: hypothetical protein V2A74_07515 [bacterium]